MAGQEIESGRKVVKLGGTSLANAERIRTAADIIQSDPRRRVVVVSAQGAADSFDPLENFRMTQALRSGEFDIAWRRNEALAEALFGVGDPRYLKEMELIATDRRSITEISPYAESRGEIHIGKMFADLLGATFIDPSDALILESNGAVHVDTYVRIRQLFQDDGRTYVMAGYSGINATTGEIQLLPPGGSDLSGSILAEALNASLYENFTDVDGVKAAHPKVVQDAQTIPEIIFEEMGDLALRGANVLLSSAIEPAKEARIPINVRNSKNPSHPGTMVVEQRIAREKIIGIAHRTGHVAFKVSWPGMSTQIGAVRDIADVFVRHGISLEQGPGQNDTVSIICHSDQFTGGREHEVMRDLFALAPEKRAAHLDLSSDIGIISLVGQRIAGNATRVNRLLYEALDDARIVTGVHVQPESPTAISFSVPNDDVHAAVNVVYDKFFR